MKRWILVLLPTLIFASPTSELAKPPAEPCVCENWLHFSDSDIAVCLSAGEGAGATFNDIDGDD
jgi:hypothetical protein